MLLAPTSASAATCNTDLISGSGLCGVDFAATVGDQFSGVVATYTGPQPAEGAVTIEWGDGSSSPGTRANGEIMGSHVYASAGSYAVTVSDPVPGSGIGVIGIGSPKYLTATAVATIANAGSNRPPRSTSAQTALVVPVSGSQVYGSPPLFEVGANPPSGDILTGTLTCGDVGLDAVQISPTLAPGRYRLDGESCFGLGLTGLTASDYTLSFEGGRFFVAKAPTSITAASVRRDGRRLRFAARLVGDDGPLAGALIVFSDRGRAVCRATTDGLGRAACTAARAANSSGHARYKASFASTQDYLAARSQFEGPALLLGRG